MAIPDAVEHFAIPGDRVKLEVHHHSNGRKNFWLFSSVAAIELREEDIKPLGKMLLAWSKYATRKRFTSWFEHLKEIDRTLKEGGK